MAFDRRINLTEKNIIERLMDKSLVKMDQFDFFKSIDKYLESIKPVKAGRTIIGKNTVFNFLKDYQTDNGHELSFQGMNLEFFEALRKYAFKDRKIEDKEGKLIDGTIEELLR